MHPFISVCSRLRAGMRGMTSVQSAETSAIILLGLIRPYFFFGSLAKRYVSESMT